MVRSPRGRPPRDAYRRQGTARGLRQWLAFSSPLAVCAGAPVLGQAPPAEPAVQVAQLPGGWCFRGKPLPQCRHFWVVEFGLGARLDDPPSSLASEGEPVITVELGQMFNLDRRSAVGGALYLGSDEEWSRFGLKPRYRRWLGRRTSLELAPGVLIAGEHNALEPEYPGFTGHLGVNLADWLAVVGQVEVVRFRRSRLDLEDGVTDVAWYGGITANSYAALLAPIALGVLIAATWD